jgi:hypothetical protein
MSGATIIEDFTAEEALTSDSVWVTHRDSDRMFKVEVIAANSRIITVDFQGKKMSFTYRWEHWGNAEYRLTID